MSIQTIQRIFADVLAWILVGVCGAFIAMNVGAILKNWKSEFKIFWMVQCLPLVYLALEYATAAIRHESIGMIDGRSAMLLVLVVGLMERIVHVRSRDERNKP